MDVKLLDWSFYATLVTLLIPLGFFAAELNRQPRSILWLVISLFFSLCCDIGGTVLINLGRSPNVAGTVYWLLGLIPLSMFFNQVIKSTKLTQYLWFINVSYLLFGLVNFLFIQTKYVNSYNSILHALVILILSILYFNKLLRDLPAQQLQRLPMFWIISGFFFSYAGKLVIYTVTHYLIHFVQDTLIIVWSFHNFLTIIANLLIGYGAWLNHKQLRSTSLSL